MHPRTPPDKAATIQQLNSFLRGELSATETYELALRHLALSEHRGALIQVSRSHAERARLLTTAIEKRGGEPASSSGAWGSFVRIIERSAVALSEESALAALEEGEDHGHQLYLRDLGNLDDGARQLIEHSILPEQRRTHDVAKAVRRSLAEN